MARITTRTMYSVGIFVLAALVAAAIVISVVLLVQHRGEQARKDQAKEVAVEINDRQKAAEAAAKKDNEQQTKSDVPTRTESASTEVAVTSTAELPHTGPAETVKSIAIVALLAFSVAAYVGSRSRQIRQL